MPRPRSYGRDGRTFTAPVVHTRITRDCPDCGAAAGNRCFRLTSWVVPRIPLKGFFTERIDGFHAARRSPDEPVGGLDPRTALRKRIGSLAMTKLPGNERMLTRRWAGSTRRVEQELVEKVAELEALPDLTW